MSEFWEHYKDPRWQRRRLEIMQNAGFQCETCESGDKTLNVHHKIYRRGAMPWEYPDHELACLCEECHERETHLRSRLKEAMALLDEHDLERLLGYAHGIILLSGFHDVAGYKIESICEAEGMSDVVTPSVWIGNVPADYELLEFTQPPDHFITSEQINAIYKMRRDRK